MVRVILLLIVAVSASLTSFAQNNVTKFLGIPIDGTKTEMIAKLKAKGFTLMPGFEKEGMMEGEFNGTQVWITPQTNNNRVWRLAISDAYSKSEGQIKIRYNNLCYQFQNNSRYMIGDPSVSDFSLSDSEDIRYEITIRNQQYQATFYQDKEIPGFLDRRVWFMISESFGEYRVHMFYENLKNRANGEDL